MKLYDALARLAPQIGKSADELLVYTSEDVIGGWHPDLALRRWDLGSMFEVEGQFIYALVRALKPQNVLEIGVGNGCATTHILAALVLNGYGRLTSVDPHPYNTDNVPKAWRDRWEFIPQDGVGWIAEHGERHFDIVVEDAMHSYEMTHDIIANVAPMRPHVVLSHDSEHGVEGDLIRRAWTDIYGTFDSVLIEPSDCGLAWKVLS